MARDGVELWQNALRVAACLAVDPHGLRGVCLRAQAGPVRDAWLAAFQRLLPADAPWKRVPLQIADSRLIGGLDLVATLAAHKPIAERGVLTEADGGIAVVAMAERIGAATAARMIAALDDGEVRVERDGISAVMPARFGMVLLDEGIDGGDQSAERAPRALLDRVAFHLDLSAVSMRDVTDAVCDSKEIQTARQRLPNVRCDDDVTEALCAASISLGIHSLRAPMLASRVASVLAALDGRNRVDDAAAALAAELVFAPRATALPPQKEDDVPEPQQDEMDDQPVPEHETQQDSAAALADVVLDATKAAIPLDLLAQLQVQAHAGHASSVGNSGVMRISAKRGRPIGARRGLPRDGARISVLDTLRAAAPWQRLRGNTLDSGRVEIRREDFHVRRFKQRMETTIIFAVDASGSAALHRLAEAKGAVELLLADCYVRRDRVALISFRGKSAEVLLPPTRSLVRAKRSLAALPGGGATPLASAIDAANALAQSARRRGETPAVVFLTDGRANMSRDGTPGRTLAEAEANTAARLLNATHIGALFIDTSPQPQLGARSVAAAMGATYVALPYADAVALSRTVRAELDARG
jgi:magnesium chelatase subunit D